MNEPVDAVAATRRRRVGAVARVVFVVAAAGFAAWAFRDDWPRVLRLVGETPGWATVGAVVLMIAGVVLTIPMWIVVTRGLDMVLPRRTAAEILLIGQLGKYLPGSLWTVAAQAQLLRRRDVPVRRAVTASLLYIGIYLAMSLTLGGLVLAVAGNPWGIPPWLCAVVALAAASALTPPALRLIVRVVAGRASPFRFSWAASGLVVATTTASWACWIGAPLLLARSTDPTVVVAIAAAALVGYAAGLVVVIAPAGLGVREAVFVAIVAPVTDLTTALSLALLSRVAALVADLLLAGVAWALARRELSDDAVDASVAP